MLKLTDYIGLGNAEYSDELIGLRLSTRLHIGGKAGPSYIDVLLSGVSPLALTNALGLNYIKALGATEQNGIPTPDAPMDIICNNGVLKYGQYGKNLFDKNNTQMAKEWRVENDGKVYKDIGSQTIVIPVQPNTTYTVQADLTGYSPSSPPVGRIVFFTTYPVPNTTVGTVHTQVGSRLPYTFTTGNNTAYVAIWLNRTGNIAQQVWNSAQLEQGSTATEYEPYHFGIHADGTVETINVHGKNLFNKDNVVNGYRINSLGEIVSSSRACYFPVKIKVKNGDTITISGLTSTAAECYTVVYDNAGNRVQTARTRNTTFTIKGQDASYMMFSCDKATTPTVMLEFGSTPTAYEPYYNGGTATAEMLLKVGTYQDNQELLTGNITRNVGIKVLDGTESWIDTAGNAPYRLSIPDMATGATIGKNNVFGFCSHFQAVSNNSSWATYQNMVSAASANASLLFRYQNNTSTLNNFKQYLADQYANGTPVIVVYLIATPTTETVSGQSLTASGNCTVTATGSLDNLELEVSYKQGVVVRIQEASNESLDNQVNVTIS